MTKMMKITIMKNLTMRMTQGTGPYFVFSYLKEINNENTSDQFQFRWSKNSVIEISNAI